MKVLGDRERKEKKKYDRMSGCGKRDFDMKKMKRRRWKRTNSDTKSIYKGISSPAFGSTHHIAHPIVQVQNMFKEKNIISSHITHGSFFEDVPSLVRFPISQTSEQKRLERGVGIIVLGLLELAISHDRLGTDGIS